MPQFFVTSRSGLRQKAKRVDATHVVSLIDPESSMVYRPSRVPKENHLTRRFDDVMFERDTWSPDRNDVRVLAEFCRRLPPMARVVVHCEAGVSRSTATALAFHCFHNGLDGAFEWLMNERSMAMPNPLLTKWFDEEFGFEGKLHCIGEMASLKNVHKVYG